VRADHPKTRASEMVGFLDTGVLKAGEVAELSEHVLRLSGQPHDAAMAERGGKLFAEHCVACHGPQGRGLREQGAPNLTDKIWLYGGGRAELQRIIAKGRRGVMPAWGERLDEVTVRKLALYVHALGGGE
jgi:cytochrome c oxidase cbb3-type subunit 3